MKIFALPNTASTPLPRRHPWAAPAVHPSAMARAARAVGTALVLSIGVVACAAPTGSGEGTSSGGKGKVDSSIDAVIVNFEFDGEFLVDGSTTAVENHIEEQLLYTVGQLNGDDSVSRLDRVDLSNVETKREGTETRVSYTARIPVAWGDKNEVPDEYTFYLPLDMSIAGQERFTEQYKHDCVDWSAHDVDVNSMWYYYRPQRCGDGLDAQDIVESVATVTVSDVNTTGKYPEYHKVWEDDELRVLAIFGKVEEGTTTAADQGIAAYNDFVRKVKERFAGADIVTTPPNVSDRPGVEEPTVTVEATLANGRRVRVDALLVDAVRSAPASFYKRYEDLSGTADLIMYSGHSGLGANIRALASRGQWQTGQYAIVFMNGCDTYAYVDSSLWDAHAAVNPDDPTGTKYLDLMMNALPAFFSTFAESSFNIVEALLAVDEPQTYEEIFGGISRRQNVLVSGEQDNEFDPSVF
ncbi:MAG: hypothetical protein KC416_10720 [Myxococcales bacterium]|nr:hypothetical protein [Myxococcales bacterium]